MRWFIKIKIYLTVYAVHFYFLFINVYLQIYVPEIKVKISSKKRTFILSL